MTEREKAGATVTPDNFLAVSRSLVVAADARFDEAKRLAALTRDDSARAHALSRSRLSRNPAATEPPSEPSATTV